MSAGKGDTPRAVNGDVYRRNFDAIFSHPMGQMSKSPAITINASSWACVTRERDEAREDCLEQARLLAMSADREEKLRADLTLAHKLADAAMWEADRYRAALKNIAALDTSQDASPQQCGAVLLAMNALDR